MSGKSSRAVSDRLGAIDWDDDGAAFRHAHSRALLMREYLRRAALWAQVCGAEESWPFFDIAERLDAAITTPPDVAAELEQLLQSLAPASLRTTCRGAVRWPALLAAHHGLQADLPDPYEPLLLMYERGGCYHLGEYLDLNGVMIPLGDMESNASAAPFVTLAPTTLDALDAEGEMTYFAKISDVHPQPSPRGIVQAVLYPPINLFYHYVRNDRDGFAPALADALKLHKTYWTLNEDRAKDIDGSIALGPLAIACLAYDAEFPLNIQSDYLPKHLLQRTWLGEFPT